MTGVLTGGCQPYNSEPYGYFSVEPPKFAAQFKGKTVHDPFRIGGRRGRVSRASITIGSAARANQGQLAMSRSPSCCARGCK